jgi:voltage-gated potassium channel
MTQHSTRTPANIAYELFITFASILSIFNIILILLAQSEVVGSVILIIDLFLSVIFLLDFLGRLKQAKSKSQYFFREWGWADLLGCFPSAQFKIFRVFRVIRIARLIRDYGFKLMVTNFMKYRAASTLLTVLMLILLLMEFGGIAIVSAEAANPNANIKTGADAIWWIMVTITTVGYGDRYPVTFAGRMIGMAIMVAGVGVFGVFSGYLANFFISRKPEADEAPAQPAIEPNAQLFELQRLLEEQTRMQAELKMQLAELMAVQKKV